jgi:hypothetical protein
MAITIEPFEHTGPTGMGYCPDMAYADNSVISWSIPSYFMKHEEQEGIIEGRLLYEGEQYLVKMRKVRYDNRK